MLTYPRDKKLLDWIKFEPKSSMVTNHNYYNGYKQHSKQVVQLDPCIMTLTWPWYPTSLLTSKVSQ
jgi:hypothetical protein